MSLKIKYGWFLLGGLYAFAAAGAETTNAGARAVSSIDMMNFKLGKSERSSFSGLM